MPEARDHKSKHAEVNQAATDYNSWLVFGWIGIYFVFIIPAIRTWTITQ